MKHLSKAIAVYAGLIALVSLTPAAQKNFDPFPRKDEILKTFAAEFVVLTPGKYAFPRSFVMGSDNAADQQPMHDVSLIGDFAIAKYEVAQELYQVVMGENPSKWKGPRNAVELTSWRDATAFCTKVTTLLRAAKSIDDKTKIRLPTEAEWEYACRAGAKTAWSFGDNRDDLTEYCWYKDNSKGFDPPVGMKKANPWGLFDMHGYNWEWVEDDYAPNYKNAPKDGKPFVGPAGSDKVVRGGAWNAPAESSRSAHRHHAKADFKDDALGFRCVKGTAD